MECEVDLWTIALDEPRPAILSEDEAGRAGRFHFERDRIRWTRARSVLRFVLAGYTGKSPESVCFVYGKHGKPALDRGDGIEFNLSHAGDFAMIAVTHSLAVGVDIERMRADVDVAPLLRRLGERDLPDGIPELYRRWTLREARSKASGMALFEKPLADISAMAVAAPPGYAAAVAVEGTADISIVQRV